MPEQRRIVACSRLDTTKRALRVLGDQFKGIEVEVRTELSFSVVDRRVGSSLGHRDVESRTATHLDRKRNLWERPPGSRRRSDASRSPGLRLVETSIGRHYDPSRFGDCRRWRQVVDAEAASHYRALTQIVLQSGLPLLRSVGGTVANNSGLRR